MPTFRVVLVNPPPFRVQQAEYDTPAFGRLGLAYLAARARECEGCTVAVVDAKLERLSFAATVNRVLAMEPNLVGLGAFTCEIKAAAHVAALLRIARPSLTLVIGGVHVTALPAETLREFEMFGYGVHGEGEDTLADLVQMLRLGGESARIPGLVYRGTAGAITVTAARDRRSDLDALPRPAWDLFPPAQEYFVMSQRGCPFNCLFCMNPNGRVARGRGVDAVVAELVHILDTYKPDRIQFGDELFSVDMTRTHALLDAMIDAGVNRRVRWKAQTHVRFVDLALFRKMKGAGAYRIGLGIETGDQELLKRIGKGSTPDMILAAGAAAKAADVPIETFFVLGQPDETVESMRRTIDLAVRLNPVTPIFGLMVPFPGTEVGRLAAAHQNGYRLVSTDWNDYDKQIGGALEFASLPRHRIERLQIWAYLKVFLWNRRFVDLVKFVWRYRRVGSVVLIKSLLRRTSKLPRQTGSEASTTETPPLATLDNSEIIAATTRWQERQVRDLARLKAIGARPAVVFRERQARADRHPDQPRSRVS